MYAVFKYIYRAFHFISSYVYIYREQFSNSIDLAANECKYKCSCLVAAGKQNVQFAADQLLLHTLRPHSLRPVAVDKIYFHSARWHGAGSICRGIYIFVRYFGTPYAYVNRII